MRWFLSSKIHNATVTESRVDYEGSITIDSALMEKAGFEEGEKVLVADKDNGDRIETYIMSGKANSGEICMNGAAAKRVKKGDRIIILGFTLSEKSPDAKKILVDKKNKFVRFL